MTLVCPLVGKLDLLPVQGGKVRSRGCPHTLWCEGPQLYSLMLRLRGQWHVLPASSAGVWKQWEGVPGPPPEAALSCPGGRGGLEVPRPPGSSWFLLAFSGSPVW